MHKKSSLGAALLACGVLSTPAAFAEDQAGFYFAINGGSASFDVSKDDLDVLYAELFDSLAADLGGSLLAYDSTLDDSGEAWSAAAGYQFNRYVAIEAGYINLGKALYEADMTLAIPGDSFPLGLRIRYTSAGPAASVLGQLSLGPHFALHGRGGVYWEDTRVSNTLFDPLTGDRDTIEERSSDAKLFAGVGARWDINKSYTVRAEFQRFMDLGDEETFGEADVDMLSLGVLFR